jgi:hypothetical protein
MTLIPNAKAKKPSLRDKNIPRFPAPVVSQLLIDYLVYVPPVLNLFSQYLNMPGAMSMRINLFADPDSEQCWTDARVALDFKMTVSGWFREGRAFGVRQHRHVVIAFSRRHIQETPNERLDDLLDLQASHSRATVSNKVYAINIRCHAHVPPNVLRQHQRLGNKFAYLIRLEVPEQEQDPQPAQIDDPNAFIEIYY